MMKEESSIRKKGRKARERVPPIIIAPPKWGEAMKLKHESKFKKSDSEDRD